MNWISKEISEKFTKYKKKLMLTPRRMDELIEARNFWWVQISVLEHSYILYTYKLDLLDPVKFSLIMRWVYLGEGYSPVNWYACKPVSRLQRLYWLEYTFYLTYFQFKFPKIDKTFVFWVTRIVGSNSRPSLTFANILLMKHFLDRVTG